MAYQLIQVTDHQANVTCPHCGIAVINWSAEQYIQPCEHTLFVAMDVSFEYASDAFEQSLPRSIDEIHAHDDQLDMFKELTQSRIAEFIIYKMDLGALNLSRYVGFTA